jgi:hypothetical protein
MSQNFGFIDLSDRYCTGSSIMPQKRNPMSPSWRAARAPRGGHLMGLITLMKGQPLTYNKDNQEDKEPLFDTVDTVKGHAAHHGRDGGCAKSTGQRHALGRPEGEGRGDAGGGQARLCHRHRSGRLPGEEGAALPRRATRCGRACG